MTDEIITNSDSLNPVQVEPVQIEPIIAKKSPTEIISPILDIEIPTQPQTTGSTQTAQVPLSEPLATINPEQPAVETVLEPEIVETESETTPEPESVETDSDSEPVETKPAPAPAPPPEPQPQSTIVTNTTNLARDLLNKARFAIQTRKRVKLDRIMTLFANPSSRAKHTTGQVSITNDEVEKFLHVSDATATRYLEILEKENKIKQVGKTGKGVSYTKI